MSLFLALSCLQGRSMRSAFDELSGLGVGVQLTPGNEPTRGFEAHVRAAGVPVRTHHGFSFAARVARVWRDEGSCAIDTDSVHPPKTNTPAAAHFDEWLEAHGDERVLETMYPGYRLGTGGELERAMDLGVRLAVDVSHLFIQRTAGVLADATLRRLLDYAQVAEVHVSQNDGRHDSHRLLRGDVFGLGWAVERERSGVPLIYEAYLHQARDDVRRSQLDRLRDLVT
ncbi:MAG: hypothetical protein JNJ54_05825 [Myxococcaceae bacterium]|nr:hypothetical protein [Myxococcaceae bacterium]